MNANLRPGEAKANAVQVRLLLGWQIVSGYIFFELAQACLMCTTRAQGATPRAPRKRVHGTQVRAARSPACMVRPCRLLLPLDARAQGCGRKDPVDKAVYHEEKHWWNQTPKGLWVDLTPRAHHKKLVLVESAKVAIPPASEAETEAMKTPADRADEIVVDMVCDDLTFKGMRFTEKQLDGDEGPTSLLEACWHSVEKTYRDAKKGEALDKTALKDILIDGVVYPHATTDSARTTLNRPGLLVTMAFHARGSAEHQFLKTNSIHGPRLREGKTLCFSRLSQRTPPLGLPGLRTFADLIAAHRQIAVVSLHLDDMRFGSEGLVLLAPLLAKHMPNVELLVLHSNLIGDPGVAALVANPPAKPLLHLDLSNNELTDVALGTLREALAAMTFKVGEVLRVEGNAATTEEARRQLAVEWKRATKTACAEGLLAPPEEEELPFESQQHFSMMQAMTRVANPYPTGK